MSQARGNTPAASYQAHPYLDPRMPSRHPALVRHWLAAYRAIRNDAEGYQHLVRSYLLPIGSKAEEVPPLEDFFADSDVYLDDLLALLPDAAREPLQPTATTRAANDLLTLFRQTFEGDTTRVRYEAQRKLCLTNLLFHIEHARTVRDGHRHRAWFESVLNNRLWSALRDELREVELCMLEPDAGGGIRLDESQPPLPSSRCFRFNVRALPPAGDDHGIEVYLYRSRFKRESGPMVVSAGKDGVRQLVERPHWSHIERRSGSILSKMIRLGIGNPSAVQDVLGAAFIVGDRRQAYALERRLVRILGGPLRWRDRVDSLSGEHRGAGLGQRSSPQFRVLKGIVDLLIDDPAGLTPYLFPVELQIYPLEDYLRTLHDAHFASHTAYKRRQLLEELLPALFPLEVYGEDVARVLTAT